MTGLRKKIVLLVFASIFMLSTGNAIYANPHRISTMSVLTEGEGSSEGEAEKVINNVKVFYNPIAEQITISFKLAKQNTVVIKVMDALGNEVLSLMNGRLDAGMQNLSFEANGKLTPGFYFVRVTSGTETIVKRISVR